MKLSIIIINYRSVNLLQRLLKSLAAFHQELDYEIMLVNNWPAEQADIIKIIKHDSRIRLVTPPHNFYFAPSINLAATYARGQYLVFLNVDTYFTQPTLGTMTAYLDTHLNYGAVVGTIHDNATRTISPSGNELPTVATELVRHTFISKIFSWARWSPAWYRAYVYANWDRTTDRDIAAGCDAFLMIRADIFKNIGSYSARLLMYLTEEDIGRKLCSAGLKMRHLAQATLFHDWSHSTKKVARAKIQAIMIWDRYVYFKPELGLSGAFLLAALTAILNPMHLPRLFSIIYWLNVVRQEANSILLNPV